MLVITALLISGPDSNYYQAMPCKVIEYILDGSHQRMLQLAPACAAYVSGEDPELWIAVRANWTDDNPVGEAAALQIGFGVAAWLATAIHAIGVELYVSPDRYPFPQNIVRDSDAV
jgi:hypothetical protein